MAAKKTAFCDLFVTKTTHRFTHFPAADFREIWTQRESMSPWVLLEQNCEIFSISDHLPKKPHCRVFRHTSGARAPALAFRSTANLSTASYSRRTKGVSSSVEWLVSYDLPFSRYQLAKSLLVSGRSRNFAMFWLGLLRRLVRYLDFIGLFGSFVGPVEALHANSKFGWPWPILWPVISEKVFSYDRKPIYAFIIQKERDRKLSNVLVPVLWIHGLVYVLCE